jgi:3D (Asp-Asp-Asp) domain-containing protein
MKNLARGSIVLIMVALFLGMNNFTTIAEPALAIAIDSQKELQQNRQDKQNKQNKPQEKTDNKNSINPDNTEVITVEVDNLSESKAAALKEKLSARAFTATAYCLKGRTATGGGVRRGIVAADPRVLPLGTRISMNAGSYSGSYLVADTGGAVKGRKLDIWVPSCSEARRFGRRTVMVALASKKK